MQTKLIHARRRLWGDSIEVMLGERNRDNTTTMYRIGRENEVMQEGDDYGEATLYLKPTDAQKLMDELWNCGLRPTEGTGSAGSLAATQQHLHDMQTIAMGLLRKQGVQV